MRRIALASRLPSSLVPVSGRAEPTRVGNSGDLQRATPSKRLAASCVNLHYVHRPREIWLLHIGPVRSLAFPRSAQRQIARRTEP
jgi:hypothetical protein